MKHVLILALFALSFSTASAQTIGYGIPPQHNTPRAPEQIAQQHIADSLYDAQFNRASLYLQRSANTELAILPVSVLGGAASWYLLSNDSDTEMLGYVTTAATGIAVLVMWIVQNRYKHKAGKLLERVRIEQNGVTIRL